MAIRRSAINYPNHPPAGDDNKYSILLPTYNEADNLPIIVWLIAQYLKYVDSLLTTVHLCPIDRHGQFPSFSFNMNANDQVTSIINQCLVL
jgi:hypothetical protein